MQIMSGDFWNAEKCHFFIDTGSMQNFINKQLVGCMHFSIQNTASFAVTIADSEQSV